MKKIAVITLLIILILSTFLSCNSYDKSMDFIFGTTYELELTGGNVKQAKAEIINLFQEIENILSTNVSTSDIYLINNSKNNEPIKVNNLTLTMYEYSEIIYEESDKAFNPTLYPIVKLWGFMPNTNMTADREIPSDDSIDNILPYCSMDYFDVNYDKNTITRLSDRAMLDFGGIAKGYAVQQALQICKKNDIDQAIINVGGNVGIIGDTLLVGIKNPRESDKVCFASFDMSDSESVATSGDYERYFIHQDKRYHHIMDTYTGRPVDNGIIGVTVVTEDATISDALSTAIFCMGLKDGMNYAIDKGVKCLIIMDNNTYYTTPQFNLELLEKGYTKGDLNAD